MTKPWETQLADYFKKHRIEIARFAVDVGVGQSTVYRWLSGKPPRSRVIRLAVQTYTHGEVPADA